MLRSMHVYLHDDFKAGRGITPNQQAKHTLGRIGGKTGYTFDVLWHTDALDGVDNFEFAVALASERAIAENKIAEVRVSDPVRLTLAGKGTDWDDVPIFVIGPDEAEVRKRSSR